MSPPLPYRRGRVTPSILPSIASLRWAAGAVALVATLLGWAPGVPAGPGAAHAAVVIDVVAETRLDLQVTDAAARLEVNGRLVDNTARGIPFREVVVIVEGAAVHEETLLTDRFGRFYLDLDAPFGTHVIRASYAGEPYLTSAEAEVEVDIPPLAVSVVHDPPAIHAPGGRIAFRLQATDSHGPVRLQPAVASSDCQPEALPSSTDEDGVLTVAVVAPAARSGGSCSIRVQLPQTEHRAAYMGLFRFPVAEDPAILIDRSREALRATVVAGADGSRPVAGAHVRLVALSDGEDVVLAEGATGAEGEIAFPWPEGDADLRMAVTAPVVGAGGTAGEIRSDEFGLPGVGFRRMAALVAGAFGSGLTFLLLVLLVMDWRRARPVAPRKQETGGGGPEHPRQPRPPIVPRVDRSDRIGMVIDADTRSPVEGAVVQAEGGGGRVATTGSDGVFDRMRLDADSQVSTSVRVEAPGYRSWEGRLEGRFPVVPLVSHRRDVLASYARALNSAASLRREEWWGRLSILDVFDRGMKEVAMLRRVRTRDPVGTADLREILAALEAAEGRTRLVLALEALALLTDRSLFRPVAVDEEVLAVARRLEAMVISGVRDEEHARGGPS